MSVDFRGPDAYRLAAMGDETEELMNVERTGMSDSGTGDLNLLQKEQCVPTTREVLEELFHLLEDYAPAWYTEQHHNRAVAALMARPH